MRILLVEAVLESFSRVKDGSVKLKFGTMQEMSVEDFTLVDQYYQQGGHLAFKLDEISLKDIPDDNTQIRGQISPSKALRMKLFALHMKRGGTKDTFTPMYHRAMAEFERITQEKLDEIED